MQTLLVLALAAAAQLAPAPEGWTLLVDDEEARTHYDPASVQSAGADLMTVQVVSNFREPLHDATRYEARLALNCRERTAAFLAARIYDPAGALLGSRETPLAEADFQRIEDPSVEARLHRIVCGGRG